MLIALRSAMGLQVAEQKVKAKVGKGDHNVHGGGANVVVTTGFGGNFVFVAQFPHLSSTLHRFFCCFLPHGRGVELLWMHSSGHPQQVRLAVCRDVSERERILGLSVQC